MGSWEFKPPEVLVAILTREFVTAAWAESYRYLQLPLNSRTSMLSGMPFDHGRNTACLAALEHKFTWLMFLDDDVMPPADVFPRLAAHGKDICSGLYYRRQEPIVPVMLKERQWITGGFNFGDLLEVDLAGAGCLLIHRRVLETMKSPWFDWRVDRSDLPQTDRLSEDFTFCDIARKQYGFKVFVDTSIQCKHAGLGYSHNGSFVPLHV